MATKTTKDGITYITGPLATEELVGMENDEGFVEVIVAADIDAVAEAYGYEGYLDYLTGLVCGDEGLISDITASVVGADDGLVLVKVFAYYDEL